MSKIRPINNSRINPTNITGRLNTSQIDKSTKIVEDFNFKDAKLDQINYSEEDKLEYLRLLKLLFVEILEFGVSIVPTSPHRIGDTITAGSLEIHHSITKPSRMLLPISNSIDILEPIKSYNGYARFVNYQLVDDYMKSLANNNYPSDLLTLLIITSHEYGHYQSFINRNHDLQLRLALFRFQSKISDIQHNWLIFREECIAWQYAATKLRQLGAISYNIFNKIKANSLRTYYQNLNLKDASTAVHLKLSLIGDDYFNASSTHL